MLVTVLVFIVVFSLIILVHEFGHFWTARRCGIAVEEFGFGFPPRLMGVRRGNVLYSINLIPFGGFVRMRGEDGSQTDAPDSFASKPAYQRSLVLVAGVLMNVVLSAMLIIISFGVGVPSLVDETTPGTITDRSVQIVEVQSDTPAAAAGLRDGDTIVNIDGQSIAAVADVQNALGGRADTRVVLSIERDGQVLPIEVTPTYLTPDSSQAQIGVSLVATGTVSFPWYEALWRGLARTGQLIWEIIKGFGVLIRDLILTRQVSDDVAGPVGIAVLTGQVTDMGFMYVLQFVAVLSLTLAVINIVPFPALDGGRLLFVVIEKLRGQPVSRRIENLIHGFGFYLLIILLVIISIRDFSRFSVAQRLGSFFQNLF